MKKFTDYIPLQFLEERRKEVLYLEIIKMTASSHAFVVKKGF